MRDTTKPTSATCWICAWSGADSTGVLQPRLSSAQSIKTFSAPQAAAHPPTPASQSEDSWDNQLGKYRRRNSSLCSSPTGRHLAITVDHQWKWNMMLLKNINCIKGGWSEVKNWLGKPGRTAYSEGKTEEVRYRWRKKQLTLMGSLKAFRYAE